MKKLFEMPTVNVERFEVTDVVTLSGLDFGKYAEGGVETQGSFDYFAQFVGTNDTRLG